MTGFERLRVARMTSACESEVVALGTTFLESLGSTRRCRADKLTTPSITRLDDLAKAYLSEKEKAVDPRTLMTMDYSFRIAVHHIGNIKLTELKRSRCRAYREALLATPQFLLREDGASKNADRLLSDKSVNKHLQFLSGLLRWGVREELIDGNPAEGLSIRKRGRDWDQRFAYDNEQMKRLLDDLWLHEERPERRWVPVIAAYSGMRLEEICQLRCCDVIEHDGFWCFSVNDEAGALKTAAAQRLVPLHPELIRLGFLDMVGKLPEQPMQRLWSNLQPNRLGRYSNSVGKWFGRYKRDRGFEDRRYCFHSFRHTFINHLKQDGIAEPIIRQIVGHQEASITLGRYGKDYDVGKLHASLGTIDYGLEIVTP
nr:tyrosine-type recombinase/integrase [Minwuia sp. IMCC4030]